MADWTLEMFGQTGSVAGSLVCSAVDGGDECEACDCLPWQAKPDRNGQLRVNFPCANEVGGYFETSPVDGADSEGIEDVFLFLDWVPVYFFT